MKTRIITGAIMAVTILPIFVIGSWLLLILLGLFTVVATLEIYHLSHQDNMDKLSLGTTVFFSVFMYASLVLYLMGEVSFSYPLVVVVLSVLTNLYYYFGLRQPFWQDLLASLYPSIGFATLFAFRHDSLEVVGYIFLITIATDVFAYFVGINFGKHKLAPRISPKKSIEGSIGGTTIALLLTIVYILIINLDGILSIQTSFLLLVLFAFLISILGQIGDLVASYLKRQYHTKDFSNIFPGHGGVMDRFDSVLFVGIVIFLINEVVKVI